MEEKEFYTIAFKMLKEGMHKYSYKMNADFLKKYPISNVRNLNIFVDIELSKNIRFVHLDIKLKGITDIKCGRCLEYFEMPVSHKTQLTAEFSDHDSDLSDAGQHILVDEGEGELKLDKHFYDYLVLSIPYKASHPEIDGEYACNREMLNRLEEYSGNRNEEKTDPRWDKLKDIF